MAKASLTLPDGTAVQIEGTPEEVHKILKFYGGESKQTPKPSSAKPKKAPAKKDKTKRGETSLDYAKIVNIVKDCDEAEQIEVQILDRTSQVNRTLLPLYIVHEYIGNAYGLTSGEISKITTDLGVRVSQPHASTTLSGTASSYVMGDKVKKKGQPVRYKLSRRGVKYIKAILKGTEGGK